MADDLKKLIDDSLKLLESIPNIQTPNGSLSNLTAVADDIQKVRAAYTDIIASFKDISTEIDNLVTPEASQATCQSDQFQGLRFYDGTSFGYLRVFPDKVQLLADEVLEFRLNGTMMHTYRLVAQDSDIKLYVDGQLAIDGTGKFNQPTASKQIEFGDIAGRNQHVSSSWDSFRYTVAGSFPPNNTEDVALEEVMSFSQGSVQRLKAQNESLYASVDPLDSSRSSSIYRFVEGDPPEHRSVVAITKASVSAVLIDPNRPGNIFDTSGKFLATDNGLQYFLGGKPFPFDFVTSFSESLNGHGWALDGNCVGSCENLLNDVLTIDTTEEINPRFHKYVQAGPADPWVRGADNKDGWTVEVRVKILDDGNAGAIDASQAFVAGGSSGAACGNDGGNQNADGSIPPEDNLFAPGIYINDGVHQEIVQFFSTGVRLKYANIFAPQNLSDQFYTIRIIGKQKAIAVFAKGDSEQAYKKLLLSPDAFSVIAHETGSQEQPSVFADQSGVLHAVWQEVASDGISIRYSRLNRKKVTGGSGLIGSAQFNPDSNVFNLRVMIGLSAAAEIDYSKVANNVLIAPSANFVKNGVKPGDVLQIFPQTSGTTPKSYVVKTVLDEVLLELDTPDNLSTTGPADWIVVSGDGEWAIPVLVSENFDSSNPRVLYHSNGSIYVAFDSNSSGTDQIFIRKGSVTVDGTNWGKILQVTNSIHVAKTPDLAEMDDGNIVMAWQDSSDDATGSQIFQGVVDQNVVGSSAIASITSTAAHGRKPRVSTKGNAILVSYEDDSVVQGKFEIFAIHQRRGATGIVSSVTTKISDGVGNAENASLALAGNIAWDEVQSNGKTEIMYASVNDFDNGLWTVSRITSSRGNSRRPTITSDLNIIFESDRTRFGFYELYMAKIAKQALPRGLQIFEEFGVITGTPLEAGTFVFDISAENAAGIDNQTLVLKIVDGATSTTMVSRSVPVDPELPLITSSLDVTFPVLPAGEFTSYAITAYNSPTKFGIKLRNTIASSGGEGLDIKIKSYLTQNTRPSAVALPNAGVALAWEGQADGRRQAIYGTAYDGRTSSMDQTVLAYFPLDETIGTTVTNRIIPFDASGAVVDPGAINRNGTAFHSADVYSVDAPIPVSLFNRDDEKAFDLGNTGGDGFRGGFSISTDSYLRTSGAIDMFVTPHWPSSSIAEHIFFGNGPLDSTTPNTIVFGVGPAFVGNVMRLRIVDSAGEIHETLIEGNPVDLWDTDETVHLRAIWDADNIGIFSILGITFPSALIGYTCGSNGNIFKTTDGGSTWTQLTTGITYDIYSIDFLDNNTGWACGELGTVLVTTDGGVTWTVVDSGVEVDLKSIFFRTSSIGYAVGAQGIILLSTTGGLTWDSIDSDAVYDFNSVATTSDGTILAVGKHVYKSVDDGVTYEIIDDMPISPEWNAISRTHAGGTFTTYLVGEAGAILRTDDNGTTWTDISVTGGPDLLCVSHGSTSSTVWIPWGSNQLAYSTTSGDTLIYISTDLGGRFRAVDANFGGTSTGSHIAVTGVGGTLMVSSDLGTTQTISKTNCGNLTILVNGKEPTQTRVGDCSFTWDPSGKSLFFGDFEAAGSRSADAIMDEVVIYATPTPGHSVFNRHEFRAFQAHSAAIVTTENGKRIEWGAISPFVSSKTQWSAFKMFFCGAREPLQQFAWDITCGLVDDVVLDMAFDNIGGLWLSTANGISNCNLGAMSASVGAFINGLPQPSEDASFFTNYTDLGSSLISGEITAIAVDKNNDIWAGGPNGLMILSQSRQAEKFSVVNGLPTDNIFVIKTFGNKVLLGTDAGLGVITIPDVETSTTNTDAAAEPEVGASDSSNASASTSGTDTSSSATDTTAATDSTTATETTTSSSGTGTESTAAANTSETVRATIQFFTVSDGLPSNLIQAIEIDSKGQIWVGTDKGLARFKGDNAVVFDTSNGLISRNITSITKTANDVIYVGTGFGITRIDGSKFTSFPPASGIGPGAINGGAEDAHGGLWFATANGLIEFNQQCQRFIAYGIQDGIIGDDRIKDYQRYRILGGDVPSGACNKALVRVAVNGKERTEGFKVDPFVPWIVFDAPLGAADVVDVCVYPSWRKVHDFNSVSKNGSDGQASVDTTRTKYKLYRKRVRPGSIILGGNFADGASNESTTQYSVFAAPLPGQTGPVVSGISTPTSAVLLSSVTIGDSIYPDITEEIVGLPQEVIDAQHIALKSTDADSIDTSYLEFTTVADAIIYVAYDSRAQSLPEWLRSYEPVNILYRVSDMEVFTDGSNEEKVFVSTSGTNGCVYSIFNDPDICDISQDIAVDTTGPVGCASITKAFSPTSFNLALQADDEVTGVVDMQISPRPDFTTDGVVPSPFVPFQSNFVFDLPPEAAATTGQVATLPPDILPGGTTVPPPTGIVNNVFHNYLGVLLIGTKNPGRVYAFDPRTLLITLLFDTGEDEVICMTTFGTDLIVGTGVQGKAFRWNGTSLTQLPVSVGERVMSAFVFSNLVYLGYYPGGEIYTLDQFGVMQLFKNTAETSVNSFAAFGGRLYWATSNETLSTGDQLVTTTKKAHKHYITVPSGTTLLSELNGTTTAAGPDMHVHQIINGVVQPTNGHTHGLNGSRSGKIFRFDLPTGQPIIVHADTDYAVTTLAASGTDPAAGILFAGTSPHGKILRYVPEEDVFIKSFQTTKLTVRRLRFFSQMYAMVDDDVYVFTGKRWEFVASVSDSVNDIAPDTTASAGNLLILRANGVDATAAAPGLLDPRVCAYVRFRDAVGNLSEIRDEDGDLIDCYAPCVGGNANTGFSGVSGANGGGGSGVSGVSGSSGLASLQIGKNRLLEVDDDAKVVFALDGTEPFLSGSKVEEEVAVYYSEIFNGTNAFVQWVSLSWLATTPTDTSVTIAVRSATTSSGITSATWSDEFTDETSNDLTNLVGQFLQFRATLKVLAVNTASPVLHKVDIQLRTSQAVHYFTTNFTLPDELRRGILTYNGCSNPPVTDIIFGITGLDSTDFSDYFVFSPDKVFEVPSEHQTKNMRIGIKLISGPTEVPVVDEFAFLMSLANDARIRLNLAGQPADTSGQLAPVIGTKTVLTDRVQNHVHTVSFDASILDQSNVNGTTSIAAGHQHTIINGVVQVAAGHTHTFTIE